jgi:hypothetical protein
MAMSKEAAFYEHLRDRYKGKVYKIERLTNLAYDALIVRVEFHIPADDADEMEMYRRINKVIAVIAEGDDG